MAIETFKNQSHLEGTVIFLNAAIKAYLSHPSNKNRTDPAFKHLRTMMTHALYISDHRSAKNSHEYNKFDLIGFKENGEGFCFVLDTNSNLTVVDFTMINFSELSALQQMSTATQTMAKQLQKEFSEEPDNEQISDIGQISR